MKRSLLTLRVPVDGTWDGGTRLNVFTDYGTGVVDTSQALNADPIEVFPGQVEARPFGRQPFGVGRMDGLPSRTHRRFEDEILGRYAFGATPEEFIDIEVPVSASFGFWKFQVQAVDRTGTAQTDALVEVTAVVSSTQPPPPTNFVQSAYDAVNDLFTFTFDYGVD